MFDLKVSRDGQEPYVVTAQPRDILVWERTGQNRAFSRMMDDLKMADLYDLAYIASKRLGLFDGTAAAFEASADVAPHGEPEAEEGPTPPAA